MQLPLDRVSRLYMEMALIYNRYLNDEMYRNGADYLNKRGINLETANKYLLGYVPYDNVIYKDLTHRQSMSIKELIECNILKVDVECAKIRDYFFSHKIIFPIFENGKIICFSARSIDDALPKYKTLKYNKMGVFNIDIFRYNYPVVYIVEGAIDALTLCHMGFHAAGILGLSNFGKEHIERMLAYDSKIIVVFDNDKNQSGQKGVERVCNLLYEKGLRNIYYKILPRDDSEEKMDINQFYLNNGFYKSRMMFLDLENKKFEYSSKSNNFKFRMKHSDIEPSIVTIASRYTQLVPDGQERYKGICPLPGHNDTTPSFTIYENNNRFVCYGCNQRGNVFQFLMLLKNLTYEEAILEGCNL